MANYFYLDPTSLCRSSNGSSWSAWEDASKYNVSTWGWTGIRTTGYLAIRYNTADAGQYYGDAKGTVISIEGWSDVYYSNTSGYAYESGCYLDATVYLLDTDPRTLNASQIASRAIKTTTLNYRQKPSWGNDVLSIKFSGLSLKARQNIYIVFAYSGMNLLTYVTRYNIGMDMVVTEATVSPSTVYAGNKVNIKFKNRENDTVGVKFLYGSTVLHSLNATSDSIDVVCPKSWFNTAGIRTSNQMTVTVEFTDPKGWAITSRSFTLKCYDLSVTSPSSLMVGEKFTAKLIGKQSTDTITVVFKHGNSELYRQVMSSDTISVTCPITWFTSINFSANDPLPITVTFTDQDGRVLTASFTLNAPKLIIGGNKAQVTTGLGNNSSIIFTITNRTIIGRNNETLTFKILYGDTEIVNLK